MAKADRALADQLKELEIWLRTLQVGVMPARLTAHMKKPTDFLRSRFTRLLIAYTLGLNAGSVVFALGLAIGSALHQMNVAAFFGGVAGIAVGIATGLRISRAMSRRAE